MLASFACSAQVLLALHPAALVVDAFSPTTPTVSICGHSNNHARRILVTTQEQQPLSFPSTVVLAANRKEGKDSTDDDEEVPNTNTGMDEAFRQLASLDCLGSEERRESTVKMNEDSKTSLLLSFCEEVSLEQEVKLFKGLLEDSEQKDEAELYSDVMKDMGGTLNEENLTPRERPERRISIVESSASAVKSKKSSSRTGDIPRSEEDSEKFLNQAIDEAIEEAKALSAKDSPDNRKISDSILDDEEIMKEIEEIFEKGNERLLASLEEIRQEQVSTLFILDGLCRTDVRLAWTF